MSWGWGWGMDLLSPGGAAGTQFEDAFWESGAAAALGDHTPDVDNSGNGWTEHLGDTQVGDELGYASPAEDDAVHAATCSVGLANCTVQVDVLYNPNGGDIELGLIVRGDSDLSNYWQVTLNPTNNRIELVKQEFGEARSVEVYAAITAGFQDDTTYTVKAVMLGDAITGSVTTNSTTDTMTASSDSFNNTETRHGIIGWHDTGVDVQEFDDFLIEV